MKVTSLPKHRLPHPYLQLCLAQILCTGHVGWVSPPQMFLNTSWYSLPNSVPKMSMDKLYLALVSMKSVVLRCHPSKSNHIWFTILPVAPLGSPPS